MAMKEATFRPYDDVADDAIVEWLRRPHAFRLHVLRLLAEC
jgi:hypothetical protein